MTKEITPQELEAVARALITARKTNLGTEITMPVIYPDGRAVTIVVTIDGGEYVVHDAGFGAMFLTSAGVRVTASLKHRLSSLAELYGCDFIEGRMTKRATVDQIALASVMVANASRSVGDQLLEMRHRPERNFFEDVSERLSEAVGKRARHHQEFKGQSGRTYRVGSVVLDRSERTPIAFVESLATRASIPNHFMEFADLRPIYANVSRLAVYDQNERFPDTDLALIRQVGEPLSFGQSRTRFRELAA